MATTKDFYAEYKKDKRDIDTPFKAVVMGRQPERFATKEAALHFFRSNPGRCLVSHCTEKGVNFLAYKYQ